MSWKQLLDVKRENERLEREATERPPQACPFDGAVLQERDGVRNCPMGDYRWEG